MQTNKTKKPELLAPAGSLEKLKIAIYYGADAVYLAGDKYSLRAHAVMNADDLQTAVAYAHNHGVKAYVTVNVFAHNNDLEGLDEYLLFLANIGADGLIISDPGIFSVARRIVPDMPIHISTQANVTNKENARFWQNRGAVRVNLARELSLTEIAEIRKATDIGLEIFVHGALCISYSGRCNLSLYFTHRDANRGDCAHPCRYKYALLEEKRPDQYFPVEEDGRGTYIFNSKDLCLLRRLPELIEAGADALKIEGRMKSMFYVGSVVRVYRAALDFIYDPARFDGLNFPDSFIEELLKTGTRGYTENFIDSPPDVTDMLYEGPKVEKTFAPAGVVRIEGVDPVVEARNPIKPGDTIEYLGRDLTASTHRVIAILDQDGRVLEQANPNSLVILKTDPPPAGWERHAILRRS